jgi:hypothetical protein
MAFQKIKRFNPLLKKPIAAVPSSQKYGATCYHQDLINLDALLQRSNMLIEISSRFQMRSGGAQQKKKHIVRNSAA